MFIRTISRISLNNYSFDVHEHKNKSASIRPCKLGHDLPPKKWIPFDSLSDLESWVESKEDLWNLDEREDGPSFVQEMMRITNL